MAKPLYEQLVEDLTDKISRGRIAPGERMSTDKDLCRQYNVSSITVKRAMKELSKKGLVVRRPRLGTFVADEIGAARGVSSGRDRGKLRALVFVGSYLNDELTSNVIHGLSVLANEHDAQLMVRSSLSDTAREAELLETLPGTGVDGAVILPVAGATNIERFFLLKLRSSLPFVLVDQYFDGLEVPYVVTDNVAAGYELTEKLYDLGHRQIAFVGEDFSLISVRLRYEGYARALCDRQITPNPVLVRIFKHYSHPEGQERDRQQELDSYRQLLSLPNRPTAVVAANNYCAMAIMEVCTEMRLTIPDDLSVTGIGGEFTAGQCRPRLTYMRQNFEEMGRGAFRALQALVEDDGRIERNTVPATFESGQSVATMLESMKRGR